MLIKRKNGEASRSKLQAITAGLAVEARRPAHASCAARASPSAASPRSGSIQLGAVRKAKARRPASPAVETVHQEEHLHPLLGRLHGHGRGAERRLDRPGAVLGEPDQPRHALRQGRGDPRARARRPPAEVPDEARRRQVAADLAGTRRSTRSATSCWRSARRRRRTRSSGSARPSSPTRAPTCSASSAPSGAPTRSTTRRASATRRRSPASPTPGATAP